MNAKEFSKEFSRKNNKAKSPSYITNAQMFCKVFD